MCQVGARAVDQLNAPVAEVRAQRRASSCSSPRCVLALLRAACRATSSATSASKPQRLLSSTILHCIDLSAMNAVPLATVWSDTVAAAHRSLSENAAGVQGMLRIANSLRQNRAIQLIGCATARALPAMRPPFTAVHAGYQRRLTARTCSPRWICPRPSPAAAKRRCSKPCVKATPPMSKLRARLCARSWPPTGASSQRSLRPTSTRSQPAASRPCRPAPRWPQRAARWCGGAAESQLPPSTREAARSARTWPCWRCSWHSRTAASTYRASRALPCLQRLVSAPDRSQPLRPPAPWRRARAARARPLCERAAQRARVRCSRLGAAHCSQPFDRSATA